jgi:hypothetical protein
MTMVIDLEPILPENVIKWGGMRYAGFLRLQWHGY